MKIEVTGFSHMAGNSKKTGEPYNMARLFRLTKIRSWKNDNGQSYVAGFESTDNGALDVDTSKSELVQGLLGLTYPRALELTLEPHPEDPTRNIVVAFKG